MKKADFEELLKSVRHARSIAAGRTAASRVLEVAPTKIKAPRKQARPS